MKLVGQEGSTGKYGEMELPGVDSCGLDEGEEEEQFDAVHFKESKGKQLFNKLKSKIGGKVIKKRLGFIFLLFYVSL